MRFVILSACRQIRTWALIHYPSQPSESALLICCLRRGWDLNPRYACAYRAFRELRTRPLCDLSMGLFAMLTPILSHTFLSFKSVPPCGIEPQSSIPQTDVLSIELWRRMHSIFYQIRQFFLMETFLAASPTLYPTRLEEELLAVSIETKLLLLIPS